jgi:hypothetical protein
MRTALSTLSEVQSKANSELSLLKWFAEDNQSRCFSSMAAAPMVAKTSFPP